MIDPTTPERETLGELLMTIYDHGTLPNALREADVILASDWYKSLVAENAELREWLLQERVQYEAEVRGHMEERDQLAAVIEYASQFGTYEGMRHALGTNHRTVLASRDRATAAGALEDAIAYLKTTPVVTLAGKGGGYELLSARAAALRSETGEEA